MSVFAVAIFAVFTIALGGDALNGKIENGHYYVCGLKRDEIGSIVYTEVSRIAYLISASLSLLVALSFFCIGNRVLFLLTSAGILDKGKSLRTVMNVFFGLICGSVALYAVVVIIRTF